MQKYAENYLIVDVKIKEKLNELAQKKGKLRSEVTRDIYITVLKLEPEVNELEVKSAKLLDELIFQTINDMSINVGEPPYQLRRELLADFLKIKC